MKGSGIRIHESEDPVHHTYHCRFAGWRGNNLTTYSINPNPNPPKDPNQFRNLNPISKRDNYVV